MRTSRFGAKFAGFRSQLSEVETVGTKGRENSAKFGFAEPIAASPRFAAAHAVRTLDADRQLLRS
jgi:hypothetical protein